MEHPVLQGIVVVVAQRGGLSILLHHVYMVSMDMGIHLLLIITILEKFAPFSYHEKSTTATNEVRTKPDTGLPDQFKILNTPLSLNESKIVPEPFWAGILIRLAI